MTATSIHQRAIALLTALALVTSLCFAPTAALATGQTEGSMAGYTAIVYTANLRGDIDAYAKVKTVAQGYTDEGAAVIIADAGNFYQGSRYAAYDMGTTVMKAMREVGYDVVVPGKNDFAFGDGAVGSKYHAGDALGYPTMNVNLNGGNYTAGYENPKTPKTGTTTGRETLSNAEGKKVSGVASNISGTNSASDTAGNGTTVESFKFTPSATVEGGNKKTIGFVGLCDPAAADTALAACVSGLAFHSGTTAAAEAAKNISGADTVVCLSNLASEPTSIEGVDKVINVPAAAYGTGETLGVVVLDRDGKEVANLSETFDLSTVKPDSTVQNLVDTFKQTVNSANPTVVKSSVRLSGSEAEERGGETGIGDLYADALVWYGTTQSDEIMASLKQEGVSAENTIGVINGGNLRDNIYEGEIILSPSLRRIEPFPNDVSVVYVTGSQLLEQLEAVYQALPYAADNSSLNAAIYQVSGLKVRIDTDAAFDASSTSYGKWKGVNSVKRTRVISVNGKPFDANAKYAVITTDKIAVAQSDAINYVFKEQASKVVNSSVHVNTAVLNYISKQLGGAISPTSPYLASQGRITFGKTRLSAVTLSDTAFTYSGKENKPSVTVKDADGNTVDASGYSVSYADNVNAGTASVTVAGKGNYTGTLSGTFAIEKARQKITAKVSGKTYKVKQLKAKKRTFTIGAKASAAGKITYKVANKASKKYLSVSSKGKVTVKKKAKKGTYKITVSAAETRNFAKATKTIVVKVKK